MSVCDHRWEEEEPERYDSIEWSYENETRDRTERSHAAKALKFGNKPSINLYVINQVKDAAVYMLSPERRVWSEQDTEREGWSKISHLRRRTSIIIVLRARDAQLWYGSVASYLCILYSPVLKSCLNKLVHELYAVFHGARHGKKAIEKRFKVNELRPIMHWIPTFNGYCTMAGWMGIWLSERNNLQYCRKAGNRKLRPWSISKVEKQPDSLWTRKLTPHSI